MKMEEGERERERELCNNMIVKNGLMDKIAQPLSDSR
jgi:hypothetical protein